MVKGTQETWEGPQKLHFLDSEHKSLKTISYNKEYFIVL